MKNKLLLLFSVVIICIACAFGFAACASDSGNTGGNGQGTTHTYTYSAAWTYDETYHWHAATCEHINEIKDKAEHTFNEQDVCVCGEKIKLEGIELKADGFEQDGLTLYKKVPNTTQTISFRNGILVADGATYRIFTDMQCKNEIISKTDDLKIGDNLYYILVTNGNDIELYKATIRRRTMYTVTFNSNGGTEVANQIIEEDGFAIRPETTRVGYTFVNWDYNFEDPIVNNETVVANWTANYYTLTCDENGGEQLADSIRTVQYDEPYSLPVPVREGYAFQGWFDDEVKITDDNGASLTVCKIAKNTNITAHWKINKYHVSVLRLEGGEINGTSAGDYEYNSEISVCMVKQYIGYDWLGWYAGDELITTSFEYSCRLPSHPIELIAKFEVSEEMRPFKFTSSTDECKITGLKDKTLNEITIPNYVTSIGYEAFAGRKNLTSVVIGNGVTSIGYKAFANCGNLTSIVVGDKITTCENSVFVNTIATSVNFIGDISTWCSMVLVPELMQADTTLYINGKELTGALNIPNSVQTIKDNAFRNCSNLTSVMIPDRESISYLHPSISYRIL